MACRQGFISEERVVESVLNRRAESPGASRIRQELQAKGPRCRGDAASRGPSCKDTELERAREVWRRKFGEPAADPKPAPAHAVLLARGFSATWCAVRCRAPGMATRIDPWMRNRIHAERQGAF